MFLLRVLLPDRPGSLGTVASALGEIEADIEAIEIVERRPDQTVVDDFIVSLPHGTLPDRLVSACQGVAGVQVLWFSRYAGAEGLRFDLEVVEQMAAAPIDAIAKLVDQLPKLLQVDWSLLQGPDGGVRQRTDAAPDLTAVPLDGAVDRVRRLATPEELGEALLAAAPVGGQLIVVGRRGGPEFLGSELARFGYLAHLAATIGDPS